MKKQPLKMYKPHGAIKMFKLSQQKAILLAKALSPSSKPPEPLGEIHPKRLNIRTSIGNIRFILLGPWVIGLSIGLYAIVGDFYDGWKGYEAGTLSMIEKRKEWYGEDFFERLAEKYQGIPDEELSFDQEVEKVPLNRSLMLDNGKIPLKTYMHYYYYDSYAADHKRRTDIGYGLFGVGMILLLLVSIIRFKRRAPLYFDPVRRIVYTWKKGVVWAQYYDELVYYSSKKSLDMALYCFDKKGEFSAPSFAITPFGSGIYNSPESYEAMLSYVCHYMEKGFDSVATQEWTGRAGWYFYTDHKPQDFDEQLEKVLQYIELHKVNEEVIHIANSWGWLKEEDAPAASQSGGS